VLYRQNCATHSYPYKHEYSETLVDAHAGKNITPIFLVRTVPKRLSNLTHYLPYRILLVRLLERDLNVDDKERLSQIEKIYRASVRVQMIHKGLCSFLYSGKFFNIDCKIFVQETFEECLTWADLVIGPSGTGAVFETLAVNKPYHTILSPPHSTFEKSFFGDYPFVESLSDLPAALQRDNTSAERKVLDDLYSINEIPNPSQRFWAVLSDEQTNSSLNQN